MASESEPIAPDWDEPRGPHLPDAITRVPWQVWPFVALAVLLAYLDWRALGSVGDVMAGISWLLSIVTMASSILLGAALFWRHPDSWVRHRPLVLSVVLFAAAEMVRRLAPAIGEVLRPTDFEDEFLVMNSIGIGSSIVGLLAGAYLWLGLDRARRFEDPPGSRVIVTGLVVLTLVVTLVGYAQFARLGAFGPDSSILQTATSIALNTLGTVVGVAIAAVLLAGARGGESPLTAWWAGSISALLSAVALPVIALVSYVTLTPDGPGWAFTLIGYVLVAAAVLLLVAFALGLPGPGRERDDREA